MRSSSIAEFLRFEEELGRIYREYGLGKTRADILIVWPLPDGKVQRVIIELKILHKSRERTIEEGMAQAWRYANRSGADEMHLILFDRTVGKSWEEKVFCGTRTYEPDGEEGVRHPIIV